MHQPQGYPRGFRETPSLRIALLTTQDLDAPTLPDGDWKCDPRPFLPEADWQLVVLEGKEGPDIIRRLAAESGNG